MKILNIMPSGFEEGGIENGVVLLQSLFEERGHIVKTFSSDARPDLPHFNQFSYKSPPQNIFGKLFYTINPFACLALKKVLKEFKPDLVHVQAIGSASPAILFLLKKFPAIFTIHGPEAFIPRLLIWCFPVHYFKKGDYTYEDLSFAGKMRYFYQYYFEGFIYRIGLRNVDCLITLSRYMHSLLKEEGRQNEYLTNATTLLPHRPLIKGKISNTLLFVGRLRKFKGVDYLLKALPAVIGKIPDTMLYIAGEGEDRRLFENMVNELKIGKNVKFLGHLNRESLAKYYQQSSITLVPSIWPEAFGKVGIEAMSTGRPVIATDVGGISEWLQSGETGFLVPPKDSLALSGAIMSLLSDKDTLLLFGEQARKKSLEYDLRLHFEKLEKIYLEVVKSSNKNFKSFICKSFVFYLTLMSRYLEDIQVF